MNAYAVWNAGNAAAEFTNSDEAARITLPPPVTYFPKSVSVVTLPASATSLRSAIAQVLLAGEGRQPDDLVLFVVELLGFLVAACGVFPDRIVGLLEEESRVAGIFRVDVDFRPQRSPGVRPGCRRAGSVGGRDPLAASVERMMLPSTPPSVSIFDETTTCALAAPDARMRAKVAPISFRLFDMFASGGLDVSFIHHSRVGYVGVYATNMGGIARIQSYAPEVLIPEGRFGSEAATLVPDCNSMA